MRAGRSLPIAGRQGKKRLVRLRIHFVVNGFSSGIEGGAPFVIDCQIQPLSSGSLLFSEIYILSGTSGNESCGNRAGDFVRDRNAIACAKTVRPLSKKAEKPLEVKRAAMTTALTESHLRASELDGRLLSAYFHEYALPYAGDREMARPAIHSNRCCLTGFRILRQN